MWYGMNTGSLYEFIDIIGDFGLLILFSESSDGIEMASYIMNQYISVFVLCTQHLIVFRGVIFSQKTHL